MNKKTLIACLAGLVALFAIVAAGVFFLYSGGTSVSGGKKTVVIQKSDSKLLPAVPSDAAMLMCFSRLSDAVSVLNDSTKVFNVLMTDASRTKHNFSNFVKFSRNIDMGSLKNANAIVSLHYSGELEPLMIIAAGQSPADTTYEVRNIMEAADSMKLLSRFIDCSELVPVSSKLHKSSLLLISASETLLTASIRHLEGEMSVLDKDLFPEALASIGGNQAMFISHDYVSKLFSANLLRPYTGYSGFIGRFASWTALSLDDISSKSLSISGVSVAAEKEQDCFVNVFRNAPAGESRFASMVPASTLFAVSVATPELGAYFDSYKQYLDAIGKLDKFNSIPKSLKDSVGMTPLQWAEKLAVKEVAKADIVVDGAVSSVAMVRVGKSNQDIILKGSGLSNVKECSEVHSNLYHGYVSSVFGNLFEVNDECAIYRDEWLIVGPESALETIGSDNLKSYLSGSGISIPEKGNNLTSYFSVSANPSQLDLIFKPALSRAFKEGLVGTTDEAAVLTVAGKNLSLDVVRSNNMSAAKAVSASVKDTTVVVPEGPFQVMNSGTGKMNTFSQGSNGSLSLKDENGKGLWGIPFNGKLCGRVETIDYYANGKLQFLFASGSKLYLLDRLGRFVNPFPVDLGKNIAIGPAAYDFTGAHGYSAMVLHSDNSVGLYDLHGNTRSGWKGINTNETIKSLPELLEVDGKKYWVVRTSAQTLIYDFNGGDTLTKLSGDKMIRPDSEIMVKDGTVSATGLDGKVRNVKL